MWETFLEEEGIPVFKGVGVRDCRELPRSDWPRVGGKASYIQLIGTNNDTGMFVVEVPPHSALKPQKHMYEERYVVIEGYGSTEVWKEGSSAKTNFEWQQNSIFSVPLNAWFRITNDSNSPAILVAANTAPKIMNLFQNREFIFENPFDFDDRYDESADYFRPRDEIRAAEDSGRAVAHTNFIADISHCYLPLDNQRAPGYR